MTGELRPDDPSFSYDEQYRAAAWKAVILALEHMGESLQTSYSFIDAPTSIKKLARVATKNADDLILPVQAAITQRNSSYDGYKTMGFVSQDGKEINPDFAAMTMLYGGNDAIARTLFEDFKLARLDGDISLLAATNYSRLRSVHSTNQNIWFDVIKRMHYDSDFYIGLWDGNRQLGIDEDDD